MCGGCGKKKIQATEGSDMSDTTTKRPAHEVIMEMLEHQLNELLRLRCIPHDDEEHPLVHQKYIQIGTLLTVLEKMIIPDKHIDEVIAKLRQYSATYSEADRVANTIKGGVT